MRNLIHKILKEELKTKKYKSLKPGTAEFKGKKIVVILDENDRIVATGPYINDETPKKYICNIVDGLIEELFDEGEIQMEGLLKELDNGNFTNIQKINYCDKIKESKEFNPDDFSWVEIKEHELIKDDKHRHDIIEDVIKKVKEYKGWRISQDYDLGIVYWWGLDGYTGMATPEWGEHFQIPVDIMYDNDYDTVTVIITPKFKYVIELQNWYSENYFRLVDKVLRDYINGDDVPPLIEV